MDWNQWRGPRRDGVLYGLPDPESWPKTLTKGWSVPVGEGHASPVVSGDRVFLLAREGEEELVRALDRRTGKPLWTHRYPTPYTMNPAARGHGKGPKATPVLADGRLYTLGITQALCCFESRTGKLLWETNGKTAPDFGTAASPLIEGALLIVPLGTKDEGSVTAFDRKTGEMRWRWTGDGPGYSSPVAATIDGVRQVILLTQKCAVGLEATSGRQLWNIPFTTAYEQNSLTPVIIGDRVVLGGVRKPTVAYRVRRSGVEKLWETPDVTMYMSTPVAVGDRLYGMSERQRGQLFSLDLATGKVLWTGDGRLGDNASVWSVGARLVTLTTGADLLVHRRTGESLTEVARYSVAGSAVWASPAIIDRQVFVKDLDHLTVWERRA